MIKNLSRIYRKAFDLQWVSKFPEGIKRWNILFVNNQGKVVSFQYLRGLLISLVVIILILSAVSIYLYHIQKCTAEKNSDLKNTLENYHQEINTLRQEMNALMIRLAEAQSETPKGAVPKNAKPPKKASEKMKIDESSASYPGKTESGKQKPPVPERSRPDEKTSVHRNLTDAPLKAGLQHVQAAKKDISTPLKENEAVYVYDFSAFYDAELSTLNARFEIKNPSGNTSSLSGYVFVVMKKDDHDQKGWLALPSVELVSGKPSRITEGQFFKIRNYKTVKIQSNDVTGPRTFNKADLLVFSSSGELIFQKTYQVNINVPGIPAKEPEIEAETAKPAGVVLPESEKAD